MVAQKHDSDSKNQTLKEYKKKILVGLVCLTLFTLAVSWLLSHSDNKEWDWLAAFLQNLSAGALGTVFTFYFIDMILGNKQDENDAAEMSQLQIQTKQTNLEIAALNTNLAAVLQNAGMDDFKTVATTTIQLSSEIKSEISKLVEPMEKLMKQVDITNKSNEIPADVIRNLAKALMGQNKWSQAAELLDEYVVRFPEDWEAQLSRGVAHMNARSGEVSDMIAVRAYNEALALMPISIDKNFRARIFTYRAAAFKRLLRLDEMEADLEVAQKYASKSREINDLDYNLACLYALRGEKDKLLSKMGAIHSPRYIDSIRKHMADYFKKFSQDKDFLKLLSEMENKLNTSN